MRIASDGTWFYRGSPINRKPLVRLFSTVLRRDAAGVYWLQTPVEKGRIQVDDAPFTAVELSVTGAAEDQVLSFRTNLDAWIPADSAHPIRIAGDPESGEPRPYIEVRDNLEALILRPVFYELANLAVPRPGGDGGAEAGADGGDLGVWSAGTFFPLNPL